MCKRSCCQERLVTGAPELEHTRLPSGASSRSGVVQQHLSLCTDVSLLKRHSMQYSRLSSALCERSCCHERLVTGSSELEHIRQPNGASSRRGSYSSTSPSAHTYQQSSHAVYSTFLC